MDCGHGWHNDNDCDICRPSAVFVAGLRGRISELEGELRGVIREMERIAEEARVGRRWDRVEMMADNMHTALRNKLD